MNNEKRSLFLSCFHDEVCTDKYRIEHAIDALKDELIYVKLKMDVLKRDEEHFQENIGDLLVQAELIEKRIEHDLPELERSLRIVEHKLDIIRSFEIGRA